MRIHLIFDLNELDNNFVEALKSEGHIVEVSSNYSAASKSIISGQKPDVIICSDNAFEGSVNDKYDYLTVYLQELRNNVQDTRIILVATKQPYNLEFIQDCKELRVELQVGGELDIDLSQEESKEAVSSSYKAAGDISVILAVPDTMETRIRSINKVNVVAKAKSREELEQKATLLLPDIVIATFDLPGEEDLILITKRIPHETRIVMVEPEDMNIMIHDRLLENGVEFIQDISVEVLEKVIVKNSLEDSNDNNNDNKPVKKAAKKKDSSKKLRGKRINFNIDKFVDAAGSVSNATQTVASAISEAGHTMAKNFKLSVKSQTGKLYNVIAVSSPVPTGKSFISANISTKLVEMGYKVTLIDLSRSQSQHAYFKMDNDEDCLKRAIELTGKEDEDYDSLAYEPRNMKGLSIYACDPDIKVKFTSSGILKLMKHASETSDYVIVDMPHNNGGFSAAVSSAAALTLITSDMDMAHVAIFMRTEDYSDIENKALIINKYFQSGGINISHIRNAINIDQDSILTIPCKHSAAIQGIYSGIPAACFDNDLAAAFLNIADFIERKINIESEVI